MTGYFRIASSIIFSYFVGTIIKASKTVITISYIRNSARVINRDVKRALYLCELQQFIAVSAHILFNLSLFISCIRLQCTVCGRSFRLSSHNDHTGLRNNLLLVCLVNVAGQSRNQQGSQDSQNDQNDDQFNEGEALFCSSVS